MLLGFGASGIVSPPPAGVMVLVAEASSTASAGTVLAVGGALHVVTGASATADTGTVSASVPGGTVTLDVANAITVPIESVDYYELHRVSGTNPATATSLALVDTITPPATQFQFTPTSGWFYAVRVEMLTSYIDSVSGLTVTPDETTSGWSNVYTAP